MKVKALSRSTSSYQAPGSAVTRQPRNYDPAQHPLERAREYTRALNAVKMERMFAQPFVAQLGRGRECLIHSCQRPWADDMSKTLTAYTLLRKIRITSTASQVGRAMVLLRSGHCLQEKKSFKRKRMTTSYEVSVGLKTGGCCHVVQTGQWLFTIRTTPSPAVHPWLYTRGRMPSPVSRTTRQMQPLRPLPPRAFPSTT